MRRKVTLIPINSGGQRAIVRYEDDPSPKATLDSLRALLDLFQAIHDQPALIQHQIDCPEELVFRHNGNGWIVEAISILPGSYNGVTSSEPNSTFGRDVNGSGK